MEKERESITQMRVGLYRKALNQLREDNELAEREAELKEAEARSGKEPDEPGSDHATARENSDKA